MCKYIFWTNLPLKPNHVFWLYTWLTLMTQFLHKTYLCAGPYTSWISFVIILVSIFNSYMRLPFILTCNAWIWEDRKLYSFIYILDNKIIQCHFFCETHLFFILFFKNRFFFFFPIANTSLTVSNHRLRWFLVMAFLPAVRRILTD